MPFSDSQMLPGTPNYLTYFTALPIIGQQGRVTIKLGLVSLSNQKCWMKIKKLESQNMGKHI